MNKFFTNSFKALAIVALLSNVNGFAMEATPAATQVAEAATTAGESVKSAVTEAIDAAKSGAAKPEAGKGCGCKFTEAISKAWKNASKTFTDNKDAVVKRATDMKANGWSKWTTNEKAGVVIGGIAVAAATGFLVYKAYKAFTTPKAKSNVRNNRA